MTRYGLVGKLPAENDFVRHGLGGAGTRFDVWLQRAVEALPGGGSALGETPVRCALGWLEEDEVILASIARSQDGVGRSSPLAIFERVPVADLRGDFAVLPAAAAAFFDAAAALADAAQQLPLLETIARLEALPETSGAAIARARAVADRTLADEKAGDFEARALGSAAEAGFYAYHTVLLAAAPFAGEHPKRPGPLLDCAVSGVADVFVWLEVVRRLLDWGSAPPPSFLWSVTPSPRLLVSLGTAPPRSLAALLGAEERGSSLAWPLVTQREEARAEAAGHLAQPLQGIGGADASLGELVALLARLGPGYVP